ncbi:AP2-like ethylene-responsive transcription factor AIL6 [Salvia hispanica]|uniref:AP2-like ethylene-responsive transcription factor AIL6 n=1 Tax=Salvia hispanica TaxID=49212 RepID=UPI002009993E|nr:AP2-like ethylene-responsive transcription factor AIL6 [Salvia hispanica]
MAPDNNWLSFSLSSMEMLNSSSISSSSSHHHQPNDSHHYYSMGDNYYTNAAAAEQQHIYGGYPPPKLEDFFAGGGGDSTETQDSTLTHIYGAGESYFGGDEQQDLKSIIGFQAFSGDAQAHSPADYSPHCPVSAAENALSLDVNIDTSKAVDNCKKIADTFGQRTSIYRGVTRHRWTGRYEAHLWDNSCRREGQARKGRQVYLGGYDKEDKAARAYDLAALKYWGPTATTNFPISNYTKEVEDMKHMTKQEFIASLRRKSSGFSRGASMYRGVTRHHQQGRWQARIGRVAGNKDLYLGTFATEEEAAEAYDIAAIKFRGINAVTNFEMNRYDVEAIAKSPLPIGGTAKRLKLSLEGEGKAGSSMLQTPCNSSGSSISFAAIQPSSGIPCGVPLDNSTPYYYHHHNLFYPNNPVASDTSSSVSLLGTPMNVMPTPGEYFVWPHHTY